MEREQKKCEVNVIHEKTFIISLLPTTTFNETESVTNEFFRYGFGFSFFLFSVYFNIIFNVLPSPVPELKSTRKLFHQKKKNSVEIFFFHLFIQFPIWLVLSFYGTYTRYMRERWRNERSGNLENKLNIVSKWSEWKDSQEKACDPRWAF